MVEQFAPGLATAEQTISISKSKGLHKKMGIAIRGMCADQELPILEFSLNGVFHSFEFALLLSALFFILGKRGIDIFLADLYNRLVPRINSADRVLACHSH